MRYLFSIAAAALVVGCTSTSPRESAREPAEAPFSPVEADYCMAIRGNGENIAAHWEVMGRLVERLGMPKVAAGGSSGSVSLFLLDSLAGNKAINAMPPEPRSKAQGLMLKTMPEFVAAMAEHDQLVNAFTLVKAMKDPQSQLSQILAKLQEASNTLSKEDVATLVSKYGRVFSPILLRGLTGPAAFYYKQQVQDDLKTFGSFDATDINIFFRPGVVDFKYLALLIGTIGDFYAGNTSTEVAVSLGNYIDACAEKAFGQSLDQACTSQFHQLVGDYLGNKNVEDFANIMVFEPVGANLASLASTAVVMGNSLTKKYRPWKTDFDNGVAHDYGQFFAAASDVKFGYFGRTALLKEVAAGVRKNHDYKSRSFYALGEVNWLTVLATSPAEPGLDAFQPVPQGITKAFVMGEIAKPFTERWSTTPYRRDLMSAGGWSDLQPMLVLKAGGCTNVAYVTRQGGETTFGQQASIRLLGEDKPRSPGYVSFWKSISDAADKAQNDSGFKVTGTAAKSVWNQLWNRGNPTSSHNLSLAAADVVGCTNWDAFDIPSGEYAMLADALAAPFIVTPDAPPEFQPLSSHLNPVPAGCGPQH